MEIEGIVLRTVPFKEKDAMVTILSKDGPRSFYARGVLNLTSKNSASVSLYSRSRFELQEGKAGGLSLKSGELLESFTTDNNTLSSLASLSIIGEVTVKCLESFEDHIIYDYLYASLQALKEGFDPYTITMIYLANIMKVCGYGLTINKCALCGIREKIVSYSYIEGGLICEKCFDPFMMTRKNEREINIIRYIFMVKACEIKHMSFEKEEALKVIHEIEENLLDALGVRVNSIKLLL